MVKMELRNGLELGFEQEPKNLNNLQWFSSSSSSSSQEHKFEVLSVCVCTYGCMWVYVGDISKPTCG